MPQANPFDQFDTPEDSGSNPFDQFDDDALSQAQQDEELWNHYKKDNSFVGEIGKAFRSWYPTTQETVGGRMQELGSATGTTERAQAEINIQRLLAQGKITQAEADRERRSLAGPLVLGAETSDVLKAKGAAMAARGRAGNEALAPTVDPWSIAGFTGNIIRSGPPMAEALAAGIITKKLGGAADVLGATDIGASQAGQKYSESIANGRTPNQAIKDSFVYGAAEGIPELMPLGEIMKEGTKLLRRAVVGFVTEAPSEMVTQAIEDAYDRGELGRKMTMLEAIESVGYAGLVGGGMGTGAALATHPFVHKELTPEEQRAKALADFLDNARVGVPGGATNPFDRFDQPAPPAGPAAAPPPPPAASASPLPTALGTYVGEKPPWEEGEAEKPAETPKEEPKPDMFEPTVPSEPIKANWESRDMLSTSKTDLAYVSRHVTGGNTIQSYGSGNDLSTVGTAPHETRIGELTVAGKPAVLYRNDKRAVNLVMRSSDYFSLMPENERPGSAIPGYKPSDVLAIVGTAKIEPNGALEHVVVSPELRRRGIGTRLVHLAEEYLGAKIFAAKDRSVQGAALLESIRQARIAQKSKPRTGPRPAIRYENHFSSNTPHEKAIAEWLDKKAQDGDETVKPALDALDKAVEAMAAAGFPNKREINSYTTRDMPTVMKIKNLHSGLGGALARLANISMAYEKGYKGEKARTAEDVTNQQIEVAGDVRALNNAIAAEERVTGQNPPEKPAEQPAEQSEEDKRLEELRKKMAAKFKGQMSAGVDPELLSMGIEMALIHIRKGVRKFLDLIKKIATDVGITLQQALPYARSWYEGARAALEDEGLNVDDMDAPGEVRAVLGEMRDVSSRGGGLEQVRGGTRVPNPNGQGAGASAAAGNEQRPGGSLPQTNQGGNGPAGGAGVSAGGTAPVGEQGDTGLHGATPELPVSPPGGRGQIGSSGPGNAGSSPGRIPAKGLEQPVEGPAEVAPSVQPTDIPQDIKDDLPELFPEQQADVAFAERRFAKADGHGVMFTNGTGTGKTYSGAGIIKRFFKKGKKNILVVVPSQGILPGWEKALSHLKVPFAKIEDTKSSGPKGNVVGTTYANFYQNRTLADRNWDLIVTDESHSLMQGEGAEVTQGLNMFRTVNNIQAYWDQRARMILRTDVDRLQAMKEHVTRLVEARDDKAEKASDDYLEAIEKFKPKLEATLKEIAAQPRPKNVFLSATPFAYDRNIDYANKFLFDYGPEPTSGAYNTGSAKDQFFMRHFGYRMRYNRLTKPDSAVQTQILERQFHEWMRNQGVLTGREINVEHDYDRKFNLTPDAVGKQIDQTLEFLGNAEKGKYRPLLRAVQAQFKFVERQRLLEAIKAKHAVELIKQHHALGRKVMIFHDFIEGGGFAPFEYSPEWEGLAPPGASPGFMRNLYDEFLSKNPTVSKLNDELRVMQSPIATMREAFPEALFYNGRVSTKNRENALTAFNLDGPGTANVIVVQTQAGGAGLSAHDTTGKHQRAMIHLGMPTRPVMALQNEGRIYRVGQASDAIFRYLNTGTNWERRAFADKIAERSESVENLAIGDRARTLRQSFVDAFNDAAENAPEEGEGKGGKDADRAYARGISEFDKAKTYYYAQMKKDKGRRAREGIDYYPTPEPVGLKMVEFGDIRLGEDVLEPSAGHGAIARFFPETANRTVVEPSAELSSKAALSSPGAKVVEDTFENLHVVNKYDVIVMNPPFGVGGKTAIDHVEKAATHLRDGGRIVALIPEGPATDTRFDKWMDSEEAEGIYQVANIHLPAVTFEKAGTKVRSRIVVLDKQTNPEMASKLEAVERDYSDADKIEELFNRIENADIPKRLKPELTEEEAAAKKSGAAPTTMFKTGETVHARKGIKLFVASLNNRVDGTEYSRINAIAKKYRGYYSNWNKDGAIPGFQFEKASDREAFIREAAPKNEGNTPQFERVNTGMVPEGMQRIARGLVGKELQNRASVQKLVEGVQQIVRALAPSVEVHAVERLYATEETGLEGELAGATFRRLGENGVRQLIVWAINAADAVHTARHEVVHALRQSGFFKPEEWASLVDAAYAGKWIEHYEIREKYPELSEGQMVEEAIAERFAEWNNDKALWLPKGLRPLFMRLMLLLKRVRARTRELLGRSLSADDVMARIEAGTVGGRTPEAVIRPSTLAPAFQRQKGISRPKTGVIGPRLGIPPRTTAVPGKPPSMADRILGEGVNYVGEKLTKAMDKYMPSLVDDFFYQAGLTFAPMAVGSERARAIAKDFANSLRAIRYQWRVYDDWLVKTFTRDQRRAMWDAADEESVLLQKGLTPSPTQGLNKLTAEERKAVEDLQKLAERTFKMAQSLGMTKALGLPSYAPRMLVEIARAAGSTPTVSRFGNSGLGKMAADIGRNVQTTTGNLIRRKHLTRADTEAAAKKRAADAEVVRDIRTLALSTARLEQAIAGKTLIMKIKELGKQVGAMLVTRGGKPDPEHWFTLDHPAFKDYRPQFITDPTTGKTVVRKDQNGEVVWDDPQLHVLREFEGPLKAVLSNQAGYFYKAAMTLKGKIMSVIMYSFLIHNAVIWGKAVSADPKNILTFRIYGIGAGVIADKAMMDQALRNGVDPIGKRYFNQDIKAIAEEQENIFLTPGRSWTSQVAAFIPGLFNKGASEKVKETIDRWGDVWHNKLLWDNVFKLQMGIYKTVLEREMRKGLDADSAGKIAAHFANRYAGSLPMESMSNFSRVLANILFFSRSFTLTNMGAWKDLVQGLPRDMQAQILRNVGVKQLNRAQGAARRKAIGVLAIDIAFAHAALWLAQFAIFWLRAALADDDDRKKMQFVPPSENEPGYENRFLVGYQADGRALYGRLPVGKVAEELVDWVTEPREELLRKYSPYMRWAHAVESNDKGFGQKMYDENDKSLSSWGQTLGAVIDMMMESVAPMALVQGVYGLATGTGDTTSNVLKTVLPPLGVTISRGHPYGPAGGIMANQQATQSFKVQQALPDIRAKILAGDEADARADMRALGMDPGAIAAIVRTTKNPKLGITARKKRTFNRSATPEQKERMDRALERSQ